ncbi:MFS multidrug transporter [Colletotrichum asianum]
MASGLESPPLSGVLAHDGELMNFFASDLATDWMPWSSDGPNSVNSVSEQSSSGESLESSSDNSEPPPKEPEPPIEDQQCDPPPPPKSSFNAALTCEVASLTSCLFELVSSNPVQKAETSPGGAKGRSTATLRNILQHTQTLSNLVTKHDRTGSGTAPLALDGPTKLLLLSCYAKIFQAFRQIFAAVYSGLQSGENIAELLYDLRVEDVILDGDDDLKILVLMQVVTHKLNTLGVQLGVPEKHYISVGSGGLDAPKQTQPRGRQLSSEETEPTLDAILSGSETDRNSDITPNVLESRGSFTEDTKFIGNEDIEPTSGDDTSGAADKELQDPLEDVDEGPKHVTGYKLLFAMAALNLSAILINLDNAILSTATPTITNEFHSVKDIGWYVSSYQLAVSALQPLTGKFFTYFSNKWTYIVFLVIFEVGSLICALSQSSVQFIAGRTVAGIGASGLFNGSMIIIYGMVSAQQRPAMMGIMLAISQIGLIAGPLIGGSLTQYTNWRWCFWINLPIGGFACILLALVYIPEQMAKPKFMAVLTDRNILKKFDVVGSGILIGAILQLLLALHYGGAEYPWSSAIVIGLFCGFAGATILFMGWEYRAGANALMPLEMFKNKVVACGAAMNTCLFGITYIATYFIPIYFQSILGDSPMESGIHMLPSIIGSIVMSLLSGMMVSKLGYYLPWAVFAAILTSIGAGLITTWSTDTSAGKWIGYQILYGCGRGLGLQMAIVAVQTALPPTLVAIALTILVFVQGLGGAVLISIGNTVFDNTVINQIQIHAPNVNPKVVLTAGATAFRSQVSAADLPNVVKAWAVAFQKTMYITTGLSVAMFFSTWGLGFYDVRKKDAGAAKASK